jgi:uncharacterized protein
VIFVDTNVLMYAVGREHPLRGPARAFFLDALGTDSLVSSAEVLQELMHAYLPAGRLETMDAALALAEARLQEIWPLEREDVQLAGSLISSFPGLGSRDLLHVACCQRRNVRRIKTFDRGLAAAFAQ